MLPAPTVKMSPRSKWIPGWPWLSPNSQHQFSLSQAGFVFLFLFQNLIPSTDKLVVRWCRTNQNKWAVTCDSETVAFLFHPAVVHISFGVKCGPLVSNIWLTNQSRAPNVVWWVLRWSNWATFWQTDWKKRTGYPSWSTIWVDWTGHCFLLKVEMTWASDPATTNLQKLG